MRKSVEWKCLLYRTWVSVEISVAAKISLFIRPNYDEAFIDSVFQIAYRKAGIKIFRIFSFASFQRAFACRRGNPYNFIAY